MKEEHKNLSPIELSLLTWYDSDHPLYKDPEHPTIKLAGEIGELLDLYAKDKFKPGFSWQDCKICGKSDTFHVSAEEMTGEVSCYIPLVLDELGDIWYYLRILAWIYGFDKPRGIHVLRGEPLLFIRSMFNSANEIMYSIFYYKQDIWHIDWTNTYVQLVSLLEHHTIGSTIEQLTELNYYKLNSEETNHGWKGA